MRPVPAEREQGSGGLRQAFETPVAKERYVRRLFATIADRYDLITRLLSFGRDQRWKARLIDVCRVERGWRVLDLASGTGDLAFEAARRGALTRNTAAWSASILKLPPTTWW